MRSVFQDMSAIDKNMFYSRCILMWFFKSGMVRNGIRVEDHYIREISLLKRPTLSQFEVAGRQGSKPVYRLFQRYYSAFPDVVAQ
jgi:hypothetical protein